MDDLHRHARGVLPEDIGVAHQVLENQPGLQVHTVAVAVVAARALPGDAGDSRLVLVGQVVQSAGLRTHQSVQGHLAAGRPGTLLSALLFDRGDRDQTIPGFGESPTQTTRLLRDRAGRRVAFLHELLEGTDLAFPHLLDGPQLGQIPGRTLLEERFGACHVRREPHPKPLHQAGNLHDRPAGPLPVPPAQQILHIRQRRPVARPQGLGIGGVETVEHLHQAGGQTGQRGLLTIGRSPRRSVRRRAPLAEGQQRIQEEVCAVIDRVRPALEQPVQPGPRLLAVRSRSALRLGLDQQQRVQQPWEAPEIGHLVPLGPAGVLHRAIVGLPRRNDVAAQKLQHASHDVRIQVGKRPQQGSRAGQIAGQDVTLGHVVDANLQDGSLEGVTLGQHLGSRVPEDRVLQRQFIHSGSQDHVQQLIAVWIDQALDVLRLERIGANREQDRHQRLDLLILFAQRRQTVQLTAIFSLQSQKRLAADMTERHESLSTPAVVPGVERQFRGHGLPQTVAETLQQALVTGDVEGIGADVGRALRHLGTALGDPTPLPQSADGRPDLRGGNGGAVGHRQSRLPQGVDQIVPGQRSEGQREHRQHSVIEVRQPGHLGPAGIGVECFDLVFVFAFAFS